MFTTGSAPIQVACGSQGLWLAFAGVLGLDAADPRFATNSDRVAHREALVAVVEAVLADGDADHWLALLAEAGVPSGKVRSLDDVYGWDQTRSQGLLLEVEHPVHGTLTLPGSPLRLDDDRWSGGRRRHAPPPRLGEHTAAVRAELRRPAPGDPTGEAPVAPGREPA
jgi:crotonobetainyl-CoA:carnitine CoA-transferase CaiB-like acyl-CoA transferase